MSRLLELPQELKDKIWELAFAHHELLLYTDSSPGVEAKFSEPDVCTPCHSLYLSRYTKRGDDPEYAVRMLERLKPPQASYNRVINSLLTSRKIWDEAIIPFQSTIVVQIKSSESIAWFRNSAPKSLRQNVQTVIICIHFDESNHTLWCSRLMELPEAFPNMKKLLIRFHMRPPNSYDNLLDALYLSVAIQSLPEQFRTPKHVVKSSSGLPRTISALVPGTSIETAYIIEQGLFNADWLGSVSTVDAIDEHTSLISDLFHDSVYVNEVRRLLMTGWNHFRSVVAAAFQPDRYPQSALMECFQLVSAAPHLQQSMLEIARRHEKPWFEKLMKKRIVEVWEQINGKNRSDEIQGFLDTLPVGEGVDGIIRMLAENEDMATMMGLND